LAYYIFYLSLTLSQGEGSSFIIYNTYLLPFGEAGRGL